MLPWVETSFPDSLIVCSKSEEYTDNLKAETDMVGTEDEDQTKLLLPIQDSNGHSPSSSLSLDAHFFRTGTVWTASAHIITGVIGSGVLSLAWCVAQLGWIAGPLSMVIMGLVTIFSSHLLCDSYRCPDPNYGPIRNGSYKEAVKTFLGEKNKRVCSFIVHESFYGFGIAYTITSAISMRAIQKSNCYHDEGHSASCTYGDTVYMLVFGIFQAVISQIPNFHKLEWLSLIAAAMSFSYSSIGTGLGFAKVIGDGKIKGSITGVPESTAAEKVWLVAEAFGDVAFAFNFGNILFEIQDTLKSPPPENVTMKKASTAGMLVTTVFYLFCGCFGYAAFGDDTPGNLLTGFGFYEPYWLVDFANACIVAHLIGGYQVFSQPLFASAEGWLVNRFPNSQFVNRTYTVDAPLLRAFTISPLRLCFRTTYVASTTIFAIILPYFNEVLGVLGAVNFWPLAIYFPVEMHIAQRNIRPWTQRWILLQAFKAVFLLAALMALAGSVKGLITARFS